MTTQLAELMADLAVLEDREVSVSVSPQGNYLLSRYRMDGPQRRESGPLSIDDLLSELQSERKSIAEQAARKAAAVARGRS